MTLYVSDTAWAGRYFLWADTLAEAEMAMWAIGGDPVAQREPFNAWEAFSVTIEQFANACLMGATVTDKYGPAEWCAWRDRNVRVLRMLEEARARARA